MPGSYDTTESWYVTSTSASRVDTSTWTNMGSMIFDEVINPSTEIKYLLSMDAGTSWLKWSGSAWTSGSLSMDGNISSELELLNEGDFDQIFAAGTLDIAAFLKTDTVYDTPVLTSIDINYSTPGARIVVGSADITTELVSTTETKLTNISGGTITGIKANIMKIQPY